MRNGKEEGITKFYYKNGNLESFDITVFQGNI